MVAIVLSFLLAWLTYRLIEKPIRFARKKRQTSVILCVLIAVIAYVGYITFKKDGLKYRTSEELSKSLTQDLLWDTSKLNYSHCPDSLVTVCSHTKHVHLMQLLEIVMQIIYFMVLQIMIKIAVGY
jgi:branched-subunit amino acid ABC-type transport system permease component